MLGVADAHFLEGDGHRNLAREVELYAARHPWAAKKRVAVWRGTSTGTSFPGEFPFPDPRFNQRVRLAQAGSRDEERGAARPFLRLDAALARVVQLGPADAAAVEAAGLVRGPLTLEDMVACRAIVDVDGNANSWDGLFWKLLSNSVVLKVSSPHAQWYYGRLKPWKHFIPVRHDLSDLAARVAWALDPVNDKACRAIATAATKLARSLTLKAEVRRTAKVLGDVLGGMTRGGRGAGAKGGGGGRGPLNYTAAFEGEVLAHAQARLAEALAAAA